MNQLETLIVPTETVTFGAQSFEVRGLAFPHIAAIVRKHHSVLEGLYDQAIKGELDGSVQDIAMSLLEDFVPLASMIIAFGAGSTSQSGIDAAANLPMSVQIDAIEKIVRLTLIAEGGLEKLMEIVARAAAGTANLTSLKL